MSANIVKVVPVETHVTIKSSGERVIVPSSRVEIVTVGRIGPSGPAGASADAAFEWVTQTFDLSESQQEFVLDFEPRVDSVFVYLNGLLERFWGLTDLAITLDDPAIAGDTVVVSYQKEI